MKTKNSLMLITAAALVVLLLTLTGCVKPNKNELRDTSWVLTEMNGVQPISGTILTIDFDDEQISGSAGCNLFGGDYEMSGEELALISIYNTEMYCMEPEGKMDQEQAYLEALRGAVRFSQTEEELIIYDAGGGFLKYKSKDPDGEVISPVDPDDTVQITAPTETTVDDASPDQEPPWPYNVYQDPVTGISVLIPESWIVTGIIEGEYAVLQSYPEDKYIGGEPREEGDTKCDLNIQSEEISSDDLIEEWKSSPMTTILSEEQITLNSGQPGTRIEIDSMGQSISVVTELGGRVVALTCFGNFAQVDEIAATLNHSE